MPSYPGTLKSVAAYSPHRGLKELLEEALLERVGAGDVRYLFGRVFLVYTKADTAAIRDWLAPLLQDGESLFVAEFERWSGFGPAPDREWLRERGH
jgi:hypothetical protein